MFFFSLFDCEVGCLLKLFCTIRARCIAHSLARSHSWSYDPCVNLLAVRESDLAVISRAGPQSLSLWLTLINPPTSLLLESETGNSLITIKIISSWAPFLYHLSFFTGNNFVLHNWTPQNQHNIWHSYFLILKLLEKYSLGKVQINRSFRASQTK